MPTLGEIADLIGCDLPDAQRDRQIERPNALADATPLELSFLSNRRYRTDLRTTQAGAVLVHEADRTDVPEHTVALVCADPYAAFARILALWLPPETAPAGVHAQACAEAAADIAATASIDVHSSVGSATRIGSRTRIGAGCRISERVQIGDDCVIHDNVVIYRDCRLGDRCIIHAGTVIGADGFGFAPEGEGLRKIPQIGRVEIGNDVELGANCTIDRATFGQTRIEDGVKLDNLVQVGHNVRIGAHTVIAALTGISGSTRIGAGCRIGGQVGIGGHLHIGNRVEIAGKSGIMRDVEDGARVGGYPALPHRTWLKQVAWLTRQVKQRTRPSARSNLPSNKISRIGPHFCLLTRSIAISTPARRLRVGRHRARGRFSRGTFPIIRSCRVSSWSKQWRKPLASWGAAWALAPLRRRCAWPALTVPDFGAPCDRAKPSRYASR